MGQQGSKAQGPYGHAPYPPVFENAQPYLGPPKSGPPQISMSTNYGDYQPQGPPRRRPILEDPLPVRDDFWSEDDDPIFLPEARTRRFDPFEDDPRLAGVSVTRPRGRAGRMIDDIKREQAQQYRCAQPRTQSMPPPQSAQPRITKYTSYVNHGPMGQSAAPPQYAQPAAPQQYAQPAYQPQSASTGQQPTIMYYDPQTGNITGQANQSPQTIGGYGQAMPQVMSYAPPQQQQQYVMPQMQTAAQPVVIPGQVYTPGGGVYRLG